MQHTMEVGYQPAHAYSLSQSKCTFTKGEIGGVKEKDGTATQFDELTGNSSKFHGFFVETLANGDAIHYTYEGTATLKNGQVVQASDTWTMVKGTGKAAGIKGSGNWKGKGAADGSAEWSCQGSYTLAAAPMKSTPAKKKN